MPVTDDVLPDFFQRSDKYAKDWQRWYLAAERGQLVALILAAAAAAMGTPPAVPLLCFALALSAQIFRLTTKADERWWNGRAGAESAKTSGWLYMAGGAPFEIGSARADERLAATLVAIAEKVAHLAPVPSDSSHVTDGMRGVRSLPLNERVEVYRKDRVGSQQGWYASNSSKNAKRANLWACAGIASTALALLLGIVSAVNDWPFDAVGLFSAVAAAIAAWLGLKQHQILARSYAVASNELSAISTQIQGREWDEESWSRYANDAEEAISREHTSWRASRGV